MKKVVCFVLAALFFLSLCSCAKEQQKDVGVTDEEMKMLKRNENVLSMPCYPDTDSLQIVEDVLVVKVGREAS